MSERNIHSSLDLPSGAGRLTLYDWETISSTRENLVCIDLDGNVKLQAQLPTSDPSDCFIAVSMDGDLIRANSWSCRVVWLDAATGRTIKTQFTK